jgi:hypothetical protein
MQLLEGIVRVTNASDQIGICSTSTSSTATFIAKTGKGGSHVGARQESRVQVLILQRFHANEAALVRVSRPQDANFISRVDFELRNGNSGNNIGCTIGTAICHVGIGGGSQYHITHCYLKGSIVQCSLSNHFARTSTTTTTRRRGLYNVRSTHGGATTRTTARTRRIGHCVVG